MAGLPAEAPYRRLRIAVEGRQEVVSSDPEPVSQRRRLGRCRLAAAAPMPLADRDLDPPVNAAKVVGQVAEVPARAAGDRPGEQGGLPNTALEDGGIAVDGERQGGAR